MNFNDSTAVIIVILSIAVNFKHIVEFFRSHRFKRIGLISSTLKEKIISNDKLRLELYKEIEVECFKEVSGERVKWEEIEIIMDTHHKLEHEFTVKDITLARKLLILKPSEGIIKLNFTLWYMFGLFVNVASLVILLTVGFTGVFGIVDYEPKVFTSDYLMLEYLFCLLASLIYVFLLYCFYLAHRISKHSAKLLYQENNMV